ncbi:MAG: GNAT family N-acetyltransferase [Xenococcaceae cyanobacterium MO_188.B29]|nr:GNAT family N-acetyltransferase [Xenococcaceae cyanobacterium MO_188.B29]
MTSNIVLLNPSEIDRASEILAKAFDEDPMFRYITPEAEQARVNALRWYCKIGLSNCQLYNHIYTTAGDLKGVAAWIPPGKSEINIWQVLPMLFALPWKFGWHRLGQCLSLSFTLIKQESHEMNEPHWTLNLLGVAPTYQGQGIGSLLLQPVFEQADREGMPCYVATFTEQAVRFYQKHGFVILWQGELSGGSPCIWTMKREPRI